MGQATIISHLGAGQYRVQPVFETARLQSMIAALVDEVAMITTRLTELATEISTAASDADYALQVLNAAITNGDPAAIKAATAAYRKTANLVGSLTQTQALLKLRKLAAEKRKAWLDGYNQPPAETDAWCADLTEDLTGTVGTAEIGRQNITPIIRPGLDGAATYSASRDGQHQPLAGSTPSAVFYNAALRPATEKWRPRYRTGIISNLDTTAHTADVTLDAATSDLGININQTPGLTAVPVQYMTCNATAFAAGDHVLVEFTAMDWSQPIVVGFVSDPKPCDRVLWMISLTTGPVGRCVVINSATAQTKTFTTIAAAEAFYNVSFQRVNSEVGYTNYVLDDAAHSLQQSQGNVGVAAKYARFDFDQPYYITPENMGNLMNTLPAGYGPFSMDNGTFIFSGNNPESGPITFTLEYTQPYRVGYYEEYTWTPTGYTYNIVERWALPIFSGSTDGFSFSGVPMIKSTTITYTCTLLDDSQINYTDTSYLDPAPVVLGSLFSVESRNWLSINQRQDKSVVAHYRGNRCTVVYSTVDDGSYVTQTAIGATITRDCPLTGVKTNTFDYDYTGGEIIDISAVLADLFIGGWDAFDIRVAG